MDKKIPSYEERFGYVPAEKFGPPPQRPSGNNVQFDERLAYLTFNKFAKVEAVDSRSVMLKVRTTGQSRGDLVEALEFGMALNLDAARNLHAQLTEAIEVAEALACFRSADNAAA